jgi:hypothetical protein
VLRNRGITIRGATYSRSPTAGKPPEYRALRRVRCSSAPLRVKCRRHSCHRVATRNPSSDSL